MLIQLISPTLRASMELILIEAEKRSRVSSSNGPHVSVKDSYITSPIAVGHVDVRTGTISTYVPTRRDSSNWSLAEGKLHVG